MLIKLNLLCSRLEMTVLPPPGGPIAATNNISCKGKTFNGTKSYITLCNDISKSTELARNIIYHQTD